MAHLFIASKSLTDDLIVIITAIFPSDDEPRHFIVAWNNGKGYTKPSSDQLEIHFKNVLMSPFKSKKLYQLSLLIIYFSYAWPLIISWKKIITSLRWWCWRERGSESERGREYKRMERKEWENIKGVAVLLWSWWWCKFPCLSRKAQLLKIIK